MHFNVLWTPFYCHTPLQGQEIHVAAREVHLRRTVKQFNPIQYRINTLVSCMKRREGGKEKPHSFHSYLSLSHPYPYAYWPTAILRASPLHNSPNAHHPITPNRTTPPPPHHLQHSDLHVVRVSMLQENEEFIYLHAYKSSFLNLLSRFKHFLPSYFQDQAISSKIRYFLARSCKTRHFLARSSKIPVRIMHCLPRSWK